MPRPIQLTERQRIALIQAIRIGMEDGSLEGWLKPYESDALTEKLRKAK